MVCPSITVLNTPPPPAVPTVTVIEKGYAVDDVDIGNCTRDNIIGKRVQYIVKFNATSRALVVFRVDSTMPGGNSADNYSTTLESGDSTKILSSGILNLYETGSYTITNIVLTSVTAA